MLLVIWFIVLSWLSGYRDMARFFSDGTWGLNKKANWLPYWTVESSDDKTDPFHVAGGAMWALIIILLFFEAIYHYLTHSLFMLYPMFVIGSGQWYWFLLTLAIHGATFWLFFYWIRNILMHIAGVKKQYRQWSYIWPPVLLWIWKKIKK